MARVKVTNPTSQMAFFVQVALSQGTGGDEILPVLWDDNYFSLLPGEVREITGRFAAEDAQGKAPVLEVGGWNVLSDFDVLALELDREVAKVGEPLSVTARVAHTFLDGSRVPVYVDGRVWESRWAWARGEDAQELRFRLSVLQPGQHEIGVGPKKLTITVPQ